MKYIKHTHYLHLANAIRGRQCGTLHMWSDTFKRHFKRKIKEIYNIKEKEVKKNINKIEKIFK